MGHTRLGTVPKTRKWRAVVSLIGGVAGDETGGSGPLTDDVAEVASQSLDAAQNGLHLAINDLGLRYTFFLLTQLVIAARNPDWVDRLTEVGINLSGDSSLFELTAEAQDSIDRFLDSHNAHTDISEMAQQAAGEAITALTYDHATTLFGSGTDELKNAVQKLSTKNGFSQLGQVFFGRFMARYLNFYLSRATASSIGSQKIYNTSDLSRFNDALRLHCEQSARIVRDFCGDWYSKTEFLEGIDLDNTSRFMAVAIKKLQSELKCQGADL